MSSSQPWRALLFANAEPMRFRIRLAGLRGTVAHVRRLVDVLERDLATAQAADEREQGRPAVGVVEGRADLVGDHARTERRAEGVIAVDDPDRLCLGERGDELFCRKWSEPPQPDEAH